MSVLLVKIRTNILHSGSFSLTLHEICSAAIAFSFLAKAMVSKLIIACCA